jgi:hypothetical protein
MAVVPWEPYFVVHCTGRVELFPHPNSINPIPRSDRAVPAVPAVLPSRLIEPLSVQQVHIAATVTAPRPLVIVSEPLVQITLTVPVIMILSTLQ